MRTDNPAVFECSAERLDGVHLWVRSIDGAAWCANCKVALTRAQAADVFGLREFDRRSDR